MKWLENAVSFKRPSTISRVKEKPGNYDILGRVGLTIEAWYRSHNCVKPVLKFCTIYNNIKPDVPLPN